MKAFAEPDWDAPVIGRLTEPDAAVAILHAANPEEAVLLIRRSERDADPWSGHWSLPGGRRDAEDLDLLDTALRELEEECAIRLTREQVELGLPHAVARRQVGRFLVVAPFLFRIERQLEAVPDPDEAVEAQWVPMRTLVDPGRHSLLPVRNWPARMLFPAIDLNGIPLWGFTYRLLMSWLDLTEGQTAFQLASSILHLLLTRGLSLQHGWRDRATGEPGSTAKVAAVKGQIPVTEMLDHCAKLACSIPLVSCLEIQPDYVRILGLDFEEYLIRAEPAPA